MKNDVMSFVRRIDLILLGAVLVLVTMSVLLVWSATIHREAITGGDSTAYLRKQLINVIAGLVLMVGVVATNHRWVRMLTPVVYVAAVIGLLLVLVMGSTVNGSKSWLSLGPVQVQPSELAKLAVVIAMALVLAERSEGRWRARVTLGDVVAMIVVAAVPIALVMAQPDLGTTLVLGVTVFCVLAAAGTPRRWLTLLALTGVAGATTDNSAILIAGVAALVAGALSMAAGEYVSVSTQRDTEESLIAKERRELQEMPEEELAELEGFLRERGLEPDTAADVAQQLTERDALRAHAALELDIDVDDLTSPWSAAGASMVAFTLGALVPLLAITLFPDSARVWATVLTVAVALAATGWTSARLGYAPPLRAAVRNVAGGLLAMLVTYLVGNLLGTRIG